MVTVVLLIVMAAALGTSAWIIGRHIPAVATVPEFAVNRVARREGVIRRVTRLASQQYKALLMMVAIRAIRRLKVISLKTDNLATKILQKIRSYEEKTNGIEKPT